MRRRIFALSLLSLGLGTLGSAAAEAPAPAAGPLEVTYYFLPG